MDDRTKRASKPYPDGWLGIVVDEVDFEKAFAALEGYSHFHSETLRGKLRCFQMRLDDASGHFRIAERLARSARRTTRNALYRFFLRAYTLDNAMAREGLEPSCANRRATDHRLERLIELGRPELPVTIQIRINAIGYFQLLRGDYVSALQTFKALIEESRSRLEDQQAAFFAGAALASRELGLVNVAQRHYENSILCLNTISQPLKIGLVASRLYALARHWGRDEEASMWRERLRTLPCRQESRDILIERAESFVRSALRHGHVFFS